MSDAITAANMINNALFMRDMGDTLVGLQARRDYQGEIAHLRAWLEWYERQRVALVALSEEAIRVGKAELAKSERKISTLDRENQELRRQNAELAAGKKAAEAKAHDNAMKLGHWYLYGTAPPSDSP
jgi:transposase-like protein